LNRQNGLHRLKSEKESRSAVEKSKELRAQGIVITEKPVVNIQNIVASGGEIDLESLVFKLSKVMYEPEQFPCRLQMDEPKVVFLIFSAGNWCAGAKKEEQATLQSTKSRSCQKRKS
jgi:TATA-box binding protein (TBP) (component of TFIID and TFIIIB)